MYLDGSSKPKKGKLTIFFGYVAGVGKTFAMLKAAHEQQSLGVDVVIGYVEPHMRPDTQTLVGGIPKLAEKKIVYKNMELFEFDVDAALERKPQLMLIDELAHTNVIGSRNRKRYQDVEEILNQGIDVYTTVNVQHIESLNNVIENITKVEVRETIPDYIFDDADTVKLVDINAEDLVERLQAGKIYAKHKVKSALENFFKKDNLYALREIAARKVAEHILYENRREMEYLEAKNNRKMLVCVGSGGSTAKCIRWCARTSRAFGEPWVAVYVKKEAIEDDEQKLQRVTRNLKLAEKLGGETLMLEGVDVAETIAEYAKIKGITSIVIGKSTKKIHLPFKKGFEDTLIELVPNLEVHVISDSRLNQKVVGKHKDMLSVMKQVRFSWEDFWKTILTIAITTIFSAGVNFFGIPNINFVIFYFVAILIISRITEGYIYGIFAAIVSIVIYDFYFVYPYDSFYFLANFNSLLTFLLMIVVAIIMSGSVSKLSIQNKNILQRQQKTDLLYSINQKLMIARDYQTIAEVITYYLDHIFGTNIFFCLTEKSTEQLCSFSRTHTDGAIAKHTHELSIVKWITLNKKEAGKGTETFSGVDFYYMPIIVQSQVMAVLGIDCQKKELTVEDKSFLQMIVSQIIIALEKRKLSLEQRDILLQTKIEEMKTNILRSISHDLRSPLTGILGFVSLLIENPQKLDEKTKKELLSSIQAEAQWTIRLIENVLSKIQIDDKTLEIKKMPEPIEEVLSSAISNIKRRFQARKIQVKMPQKLLMVPMDVVLIMQVFMNIFENAIRYSPEDSIIYVYINERLHDIEFVISDSGIGIDNQTRLKILNGEHLNTTKNSDSKRGLGLGLTICRSILEAHGGIFTIEKNVGKGTNVVFTLPKGGE